MTVQVQAVIQRMSTKQYKSNFIPKICSRGQKRTLNFSVLEYKKVQVQKKYKRFLKVRVQGRTNLGIILCFTEPWFKHECLSNRQAVYGDYGGDYGAAYGDAYGGAYGGDYNDSKTSDDNYQDTGGYYNYK